MRGTGETDPRGGLGRRSAATSLASSHLMLGRTLLAARLDDVRATLSYLRNRKDVDARRIAIWGDSFADVNDPDADLTVPHGIERPGVSAPLGGLAALLIGLFDDQVASVYVRGGLDSYASALNDSFCYLPYDAVLPGAVAAGDLPSVAAAIAPRRMHLGALVDGQNRRVTAANLAQRYRSARTAYEKAGVADRLTVSATASSPAEWLIESLVGEP